MDKKFYDQYWIKRGGQRMKGRYEIFAQWIEPSSRVLDVGGGDGFFAEYLMKNRNCQTICVDISEVAIKMAKERGVEGIALDLIAERLPFSDNQFDYVIASQFLELLETPKEVLNEMKRVSKKYILISTINTAYWRYRLTFLFGRFPKYGLHPYEHIRFWSIIDFKEMLKDLNLKILQMKVSSGKKILGDLFPNLFGHIAMFKLEK